MPSTYDASTDILARKKPPVPQIGGSNSIIVDPTFGTRIVRVTDAHTLSNASGVPFQTADHASMSSWNADGTLFWITGNGVTIPFQFDARTMTISRIPDAGNPSGGLTLPFSGSFSFVRPNIMYGSVGRTLVEYDFNTGARQTLMDTGALAASGGRAWPPTVSDDDTKFCLAFGTPQGGMPYVAVWDRASGQSHVLDMLSSKLDGKATGSSLGSMVTSASIDRSGRFVTLRRSGATQPYLWDLQAGTVLAITVQSSGEFASGFGNWVNQSGYSDVFRDGTEWSVRTLDAAGLGSPSYLVEPTNLPFPHQSIYDGRVSWNNARLNASVPVIVSITRDNRQSGKPWRAWDDEIIGVATDGSGKVWRFAHHRSLWDTNGADLPRANVSQDGRWCLFASNWDRTLGTKDGAFRQDIFMVELSRTTRSTSVAVTSPSESAVVSGTVSVEATADEPVGIAGVQFQLDGANLGAEAAAAPYRVAWDTSGAQPGEHVLRAVARDNGGNLTLSAQVLVTIEPPDTTPPTVAITAPVPGANVTGTVMITASASDDVKMAGVQFYVDGAPLGSESAAAPYSVSWNTQGVAAGIHTITATARDAAGNQRTSAAVTLTVADLVAPSVAVSMPLYGASVSGVVALAASATDNVKVAGVQFLVNGAPVGSESLAAPYSAEWNTAAEANGVYSVTARARDAAGNTATSAAVAVTVNNLVIVPPPAAPQLSSPADGATGVTQTPTLSWSAASGASGYQVYLGTTAPPPQVGTATGTTYTPGSLFAGITYYWYVVAQNTTGSTASATRSFTTTAASGAAPPAGSSMLSYASPYCGPSGGSPSWACGAWPTSTAPKLGAAGTTTTDPDTHNRVLRVTQSGSFGEAAGTAFKGFDAGWRQVWNADSTRFLVASWNSGTVANMLNWVQFNPTNMSVSSGQPAPYQFADAQWDQNDPDLLVGLANGSAKTYNVKTRTWKTVFDPSATNWGGTPWLSSWGGTAVCIASGPQGMDYRIACRDNQSGATQAIDLHKQTINGSSFKVYLRGAPVTLPSGVTIHTITLAPDGRWLAIDTHGNSMCTLPTLPNYSSTSLFIDLNTNTGYEWNAACGGTHWAYGYNSAMMQSTSPKWTASNGPNGPCNSDSRGIVRRTTDGTSDSSLAVTEPCSFFNPYTFSVNVHLSWTNNLNDGNVNKYPVLLATTNEGVANSFLWSDIAAMETGTAAYKGKLWRFAQTWNDQSSYQCSYMVYASPAVSRDGRWALFPSDWRGQTGSKGPCTNAKRTDVFLFELK